MSISIASQELPGLAPITPQTPGAPAGGFSQVIEQVSDALQGADKMAAGYAQGKVGLTDAVLAAEKANVAFQVTMAARNRALSAYQEIMNLSV